MRTIYATTITSHVRNMCIKANCRLQPDVIVALERFRDEEPWESARKTLDTMLENARIASDGMVPACQDTGMTCVFIDLGQDVRIAGGNLEDAVNRGVALGYEAGYLRKSMVADPLRRVNTNTNEPALITTRIVPGDRMKITIAPKGGGAENMSETKMLKPADGVEGVMAFVLDVVKAAGPNPCPPIVVGVGVGGNFDHVATLAKRALLRPLGTPNPDPFYAQIEAELLENINELGTGPAGFGGKTTALAVAIEQQATHIACLPVAVNINCHVSRHEEVVL